MHAYNKVRWKFHMFAFFSDFSIVVNCHCLCKIWDNLPDEMMWKIFSLLVCTSTEVVFWILCKSSFVAFNALISRTLFCCHLKGICRAFGVLYLISHTFFFSYLKISHTCLRTMSHTCLRIGLTIIPGSPLSRLLSKGQDRQLIACLESVFISFLKEGNWTCNVIACLGIYTKACLLAEFGDFLLGWNRNFDRMFFFFLGGHCVICMA